MKNFKTQIGLLIPTAFYFFCIVCFIIEDNLIKFIYLNVKLSTFYGIIYLVMIEKSFGDISLGA